MRLTTAALGMIALAAPALAQTGAACTAATTRGTYSVMCTGYMSPAAGAPQVPITVLGTVVGDFSGTFTGTAKVSLGGTIVDQTVSGVIQANSDCTGSISYAQKINGQPAPNLNIIAHTLNEGAEIRGMSIDAGVTMTCSLALLHR